MPRSLAVSAWASCCQRRIRRNYWSDCHRSGMWFVDEHWTTRTPPFRMDARRRTRWGRTAASRIAIPSTSVRGERLPGDETCRNAEVSHCTRTMPATRNAIWHQSDPRSQVVDVSAMRPSVTPDVYRVDASDDVARAGSRPPASVAARGAARRGEVCPAWPQLLERRPTGWSRCRCCRRR